MAADASISPTPAGSRRGWSGRLPIALVLVLGLGGLTFGTVAGVLYLGLASASRNTFELTRDNIELTIDTLVLRTRQHLDPARQQAEYLARLIANGRVDPADRGRFVDYLTASLAAPPQVAGIAFVDRDFQMLRVERWPEGPRVKSADWSDDPDIRAAVGVAERAAGSYWGELFEANRRIFINLRTPVRRDGVFVGMIVAVVSIRDLSVFVSESAEHRAENAFILYGRDRVLAHRHLTGPFPGLSDEQPLPRIAEVGDAILGQIWQPAELTPLDERLLGETAGHMVRVYGDDYVYLYQVLDGYGQRPWYVGAYYRLEEVDQPFRRLDRAFVIGVGVLAVALVAALLFGYHLSRRLRRLSATAARLHDFDLDGIEPLPGSLYREFDEASRAVNFAVAGLRWFETYLPKKLVLRLMRQETLDGVRSDEYVVTVLFSDIVGFTEFAARTPAARIADFLNDHFALVAACIEAEDGTVDKYIGDAIMAFWGAPEDQPDQASRALRAARAIAAAIDGDNRRREAAGRTPVWLRIGIHTGPALVGNIGAPGRVNYTIVGDTVNTANRLEELGKERSTPADVNVLVSAATVEALGDERARFAVAPLGRHHLRGRQQTIEVYRLAV
jgi:class 3 adenylate cyclase